MSDWTFQTTDALTAQKWSKDWWIESKTESYFYGNGLVGPSEENDIIVEFSDLEKEQGYKYTFGQVRNLSGAGITGDSDMEGNEEVPSVYDDAIELNQKRNAVRTKGKLSDQYPSDKKVREWAKRLLKRWMADTLDQDLFTAIGTSLTKAIYGGDATTTATIEAGDYMTLALISKSKTYARKATPKIMPTMIKGRKYFIAVISPDQKFDLSQRDAAWQQANREAMAQGTDNPIFSGAPGLWDGTIIHEHERVPLATTWGSGANLNGATAFFLGCGAAGIAYAKRNIWQEKTFDYSNKVGFCIGKIYGVTKAVFNGADNAVVGIRTYRTSN